MALLPRRAGAAVKGLPLGVSADGRFEKTTKLLGKFDRYPCVDGTLFVEEPLRAAKREHAFMPDVWMNVEALLSVEAKAHELLWRNVIPG
jgi:hypothetical protein